MSPPVSPVSGSEANDSDFSSNSSDNDLKQFENDVYNNNNILLIDVL